MTIVDLGAGDKESMEVACPNDQDTIRLMKGSDNDNKDNSSCEQMDVTKFTEEVENPTKERTVDLISIKLIEKKFTLQAIKLQDVAVYNNVEEKTLETTVEKVDNISEEQAIEYKKYMTDRHVSTVEVTVVQGVNNMFQKLYEGPYMVQKMVNPALFELKNETCKYQDLFNLKQYLDNEEEDWIYWKVQPPPKCKKEVEDSRTGDIRKSQHINLILNNLYQLSFVY
jgi:hypothetical protein